MYTVVLMHTETRKIVEDVKSFNDHNEAEIYLSVVKDKYRDRLTGHHLTVVKEEGEALDCSEPLDLSNVKVVTFTPPEDKTPGEYIEEGLNKVKWPMKIKDKEELKAFMEIVLLLARQATGNVDLEAGFICDTPLEWLGGQTIFEHVSKRENGDGVYHDIMAELRRMYG